MQKRSETVVRQISLLIWRPCQSLWHKATKKTFRFPNFQFSPYRQRQQKSRYAQASCFFWLPLSGAEGAGLSCDEIARPRKPIQRIPALPRASVTTRNFDYKIARQRTVGRKAKTHQPLVGGFVC